MGEAMNDLVKPFSDLKVGRRYTFILCGEVSGEITGTLDRVLGWCVDLRAGKHLLIELPNEAISSFTEVEAGDPS